MKKLLLIVLTAIIIVSTSIYTVKRYNSSNSKNETVQEDSNRNKTNEENSTNITPKINQQMAIDFKLKDLDGKEISLSSLKGKKVFLNFWATWCPPCRSEMPEIEELYRETKNSDLVIITVNIGESSDTVKSFVKENNYNFKVLLDSDQNVSSQYNIASIPTSYFINGDGNIISTKTGSMNLNEMKSSVKKLEK